MSVLAWRLCRARWTGEAFNGEGAKIWGGRWNSPGNGMVYLASSLALAELEILVHTREPGMFVDAYAAIPVRFAESLVLTLEPTRWPADWNAPLPSLATQTLGDQWLHSGASVLLRVPSVVVPEEMSYLVNPRHPEFHRLEIGEARPLKFDARLG